MTPLPKNRALTRVKRNERPLIDAQVLRLARAALALLDDVRVGPCTYRQEPLLRSVVRDQAEKVLDLVAYRKGGDE